MYAGCSAVCPGAAGTPGARARQMRGGKCSGEHVHRCQVRCVASAAAALAQQAAHAYSAAEYTQGWLVTAALHVVVE